MMKAMMEKIKQNLKHVLKDSCQSFITQSLMTFFHITDKTLRHLPLHDRGRFSNHDTSILPSHYMPFIQRGARRQSLLSVFEFSW